MISTKRTLHRLLWLLLFPLALIVFALAILNRVPPETTDNDSIPAHEVSP